jgi:hypothetical protein
MRWKTCKYSNNLAYSFYSTPCYAPDHTDKANDRRSVERKLDSSLFLLVKRNREENSWQFPQGKLLESEKTMRAVST